MGDVRDGLEQAITAAAHLTAVDEGALAAARALADKIDAWGVIVDWALDDVAGKDTSERPAVPQNDNTSLPTFLRYCDALGLTPAGRVKLDEKKPEGKGGKLAHLRAVQGGKQPAKRAR